MKKRMAVLALFSMIFLTTAYAIPASAVTVDLMTSSKSISGKIVLPKWESTDMVIPSISVSGTQLSVSVLISPKNQPQQLQEHFTLRRRLEMHGRRSRRGRLTEQELSVLQKTIVERKALLIIQGWLPRQAQTILTSFQQSAPYSFFRKSCPLFCSRSLYKRMHKLEVN